MTAQRLVYFDAFSGISGDMILGAFLDMGFPLSVLEDHLKKLELTGFQLLAERAARGAITGTRVEIRENAPQPHRSYADLKRLFSESRLPEVIRKDCLRILKRLAHAEARVHGTFPEEVHFHEVGALDTVIDIVGAVAALNYFEVDRIHASPLPLGNGFIESSHGLLPIPAPATVVLLEGVPVLGRESKRELVTPTGAAILTTLCTHFGPIPPMKLQKVGYGVGTHSESNPPNVLRLFIGETQPNFPSERLLMLETHIDDMNPEFYEHLMEQCFQEGALDVGLIPFQMKKNRPGVVFRVLTFPENKDRLLSTLFSHSTTTGVRIQETERVALPRRTQWVNTSWGRVRVKCISCPDEPDRLHPEYEDCKKISKENGVPIRLVYEEALWSARRQEENSTQDSEV